MSKRSSREIVVSKNIGFCMGVKRAVELAEKSAGIYGEVYMLDALLHNKRELERLKRAGVVSFKSAKGKAVIIPAHGATYEEKVELKKSFQEVIDATCPIVTKNIKLIEKLKKEHYRIAIVGDRYHREVKVLKDAAGENLLGVFESKKDVKSISENAKVAVIAQTTITWEKLFEVSSELMKRSHELRIFNTICTETIKRQIEACEMAKNVDCMIVIGGRTSANTKRLYEKVKAVNKRTYFVESGQDIEHFNISTCKSIGIISGTSTPNWVIEEVIKGVR